MQTTNTEECYHGRHTAGANVRREEGNNPDRQGPKVMVSGKRCGKAQTADVGLEAAII